jgi:hypothetical protein
MGTPAQNGEKYYSAAQLERLSKDFGWLDLATATLTNYWKAKNESRTKPRQAREGLEQI